MYVEEKTKRLKYRRRRKRLKKGEWYKTLPLTPRPLQVAFFLVELQAGCSGGGA